MADLSERDLRALGEAFGIPVADDEIEYFVEKVNANLDGLDAVYDFDTRGTADGERSWRPGTDAYNAVVTACDVPPSGTGVLDGLDVGVKDVIAVAGVPMECGSAAMRGFIPGFDAAVIARLRAAGAAIVAKTNLDEFAGGGRGVSFEGRIRNPHDPAYSPGGSSGGSAVAVAVGAVDLALGTDTGGSIRNPAAYCGVVGLKPTYGLVPLHGVVENTYTLDHVGPLARDVETVARALEAMAGVDRRDAASLAAAGRDDYRTGDYLGAVSAPPAPADLSLALVEESVADGTAEAAVVDRTRAAVDALEDAGASVDRVSVEGYDHATPIKNVLSYVELAAHWRAGGATHRRGGVVDEDYQQALSRRLAASGHEVNHYYRARLLAGAALISTHGSRHYTRAQAARRRFTDAVEAALDGFDAVLTPTMPTLPPSVDAAQRPGYSYGRNTKPASLTGQPAISLPNGAVEGLPVGLQLVGHAFRDDALLGVAATVDATLDGHVAVPDGPSP